MKRRIIATLGLLCAASAIASPLLVGWYMRVPLRVVPSDAQVYFSFDQASLIATNLISPANTATSPSPVTLIDGICEKGVTYNYTNYHDCGRLVQRTNQSVVMFVNLSAGGSNFFIFGDASTTSGSWAVMYLLPSTLRLFTIGSASNPIEVSVAPISGKWAHVACAVSFTNASEMTGTIYINGLLATSRTMSAAVLAQGNTRINGRWVTNNTGNSLPGLLGIDELAFWTNKTLTAAEVSSNYARWMGELR